MPLGAEHVPEHGREFVGLVGETEIPGARDQRLLRLADDGDARQIALDVGGEDRNAGPRQAFGENLQGDRLAGAGRTGDKAMTVGEGERQQRGCLTLADEDRAVGIDFSHQPAPSVAIFRGHPTVIQPGGPGILTWNSTRGTTQIPSRN
jgi:hypothetical protein